MTPFRVFLRLLRSETAWLLLECVAALALLAEACALVWWNQDLSIPLRLLLWAQWLGTGAGLYMLGLFRVLNTVLVWDLIRAARRRRHFLLRTGYVAGLLLMMLWVVALEGRGFDIRANRMPQVGEMLFLGLVGMQCAAMALLTPAYTAGAIAEEKERQTLDFLLTSSLNDRDIILGKLFSRLAHLVLILLAGLPILSLLQFLGGIDPNLLLASFAGTALTLLSLGSLSIFNSVLFRKPRAAVFMTYLAAGAYLMLSGMVYAIVHEPFVNSWAISRGIPLPEIAHVIGAGNTFLAVESLERELRNGTTLDVVLPPLMRDYALFHLLLSVVLCLWATARMRPIAERDRESRPTGQAWLFRRWQLFRPALGDQPMLWKEMFAEPGLKLHWLGKVLIALFVAGSFLPVLMIVVGVMYSTGYMDSWEFLGRGMNIWVRLVGTGVALLLFLRVAMHAAGAVNGEQHRDTMVSLLTTPLESRDILFAKWVGSVLGGRGGLLWLGSIWLLGMLTGAVHPLFVPLLAAAWLAYAAFVAAVGLWFSTVCKSSLAASVWTVLTVSAAWTAHWLFFLLLAFSIGNHASPQMEIVVTCFHALVLTPPITLGFLAISWWEVDMALKAPRSPDSGILDAVILFMFLGPVLWSLVGWGVWACAERRFCQMSNREPARPVTPPALPSTVASAPPTS